MNSIDDFARLRPDVDTPTPEHFDQIWASIVDESAPVSIASGRELAVDASTPRNEGSGRPRRRAVWAGVAASVVTGVVAVASVTGTGTAPAPAESVAQSSSLPATVAPSNPVVESSDDASIDVGEPPRWGVTAPGWALVEFADSPGAADRTVDLYAGPNGVARSWVAVVTGMSEPLGGARVDGVPELNLVIPDSVDLPVPSVPASVPGDGFDVDVPGDDVDGRGAISARRVATDDGTVLVIAGGVSDAVANDVFVAARDDVALPHDFVAAIGDGLLRTVRYRFESDEGEWVTIDVQGAGQPRYDIELARATAAESWPPVQPAVVADIVFDGEYALLTRSGFWVSTIQTSASPDNPDEFTRLADLIETVSETEWVTSLPTAPPAPLDRVAIGDSVMLGAAEQLTDAGFVVDAKESRAFLNGLDLVRMLDEQNRIPSVVVVALGTNGPISDEHADEMMDLLADSEQVVVLTLSIDRDYVVANNELIRGLPERYPNVSVLDWAALASECSGDCYEADGFHLKPDGRVYYTDLIVDAVSG